MYGRREIGHESGRGEVDKVGVGNDPDVDEKAGSRPVSLSLCMALRLREGPFSPSGAQPASVEAKATGLATEDAQVSQREPATKEAQAPATTFKEVPVDESETDVDKSAEPSTETFSWSATWKHLCPPANAMSGSIAKM